MLVAIPSKGRAGKVKSQKRIKSAAVFVPSAEADAYRKRGAANVVEVPDEVRGITPTRNWILDWAEREGEAWVVMIDDDVKTAGYFELLAFRSRQRKLTEPEWLAEWLRLFEVTEDLDYRIWGVDTGGALRGCYPYNPFRFKTYVTASCMGIRADTGIRFDESFPVKEDYEIALRCIKEDGGILSAQYMYWVNSHWGDEGGCKDYRTGEMERDCIDRLMKMYPGLIRRVTRGGSSYSVELQF